MLIFNFFCRIFTLSVPIVYFEISKGVMSLPNQLTLLRIILTPVFAWMLHRDALSWKFASLCVYIVASLTDWYDGYFARKYNKVSNWGKFLDPLADKILVITAMVGFAKLGHFPLWMVGVVIVRDVAITVLRTYALLGGRPVVTTVLAKAKTFTQMGMIYVVFLFHLLTYHPWDGRFDGVLAAAQSINLMTGLMALVVVLTVVSGLAYFIANRRHVQQMGVAFFRLFSPTDL